VSTVRYSGRLFHTDGPAQENALLPAVKVVGKVFSRASRVHNVTCFHTVICLKVLVCNVCSWVLVNVMQKLSRVPYKSQNLRQNLDLKVRGRLIRESDLYASIYGKSFQICWSYWHKLMPLFMDHGVDKNMHLQIYGTWQVYYIVYFCHLSLLFLLYVCVLMKQCKCFAIRWMLVVFQRKWCTVLQYILSIFMITVIMASMLLLTPLISGYFVTHTYIIVSTSERIFIFLLTYEASYIDTCSRWLYLICWLFLLRNF